MEKLYINSTIIFILLNIKYKVYRYKNTYRSLSFLRLSIESGNTPDILLSFKCLNNHNIKIFNTILVIFHFSKLFNYFIKYMIY